ncbi:spore germination protein [Sutcliffiella horikoshii]|uniref:spore germination protein n=1 Tax=Sutcliffiella horikoshii TaxID=79883 RepID=UPI002040F95F|nr:spore germination protein [Sutcliffiella horikoshii]MCM3616927.1 spore germination protein [Sutcliffiella horikoshii]
MPSIIGPVKVTSVSGGIINFGDTFYISPKGTGKASLGSGGANTGNVINTNNGLNATNTIDPDVTDQNVSGNS